MQKKNENLSPEDLGLAMPALAEELSVSDPLESLNLTERKWNVTQRLVKKLLTFKRVKPALVQEQTA